MEYHARITGTGSAFPNQRVTNEDIVKKIAQLGVETNDEWVQSRTGIRERRYSDGLFWGWIDIRCNPHAMVAFTPRLFTLRESLRTPDSVLSRARSKPLRLHP